MKIHYDKKHPKLVSLFGKHCPRFKQPPSDPDWKDKCGGCEHLCPDEYHLCRPVLKKPIKIKRRKKKPKQNSPKSYENCEGPLMENCERCPEFPKCEGLLFSKKPRWVIDKYSKELSGAEQKVLDFLESRASFGRSGEAFGYCYPSHEKIAEVTGLSIKYVAECIKSLESKGLVKQEWKRFNKGKGFVTHHAYCVPYLIRQKELDEKKKELDEKKPSTV